MAAEREGCSGARGWQQGGPEWVSVKGQLGHAGSAQLASSRLYAYAGPQGRQQPGQKATLLTWVAGHERVLRAVAVAPGMAAAADNGAAWQRSLLTCMQLQIANALPDYPV